MKKSARIAVSTLASIALAAALPATAFAGERQGNGDPTPIDSVAMSDCAFSGLEDQDLDHDGDFDLPVQPGVVQNWGVIPQAERAFLSSIGVSPATLCNGHLNPIN